MRVILIIGIILFMVLMKRMSVKKTVKDVKISEDMPIDVTYLEKREGVGSRTLNYDPMTVSFRNPHNIDAITDTSALISKGVRNASLKVYNYKTGRYELQAPITPDDAFLPGYVPVDYAGL